MNQLSYNTTTETFDRHGDLKLIAGKDNSKITFQVCSRTLARSSRVWDVMLYGPFRERLAQQPKSDEWTVSLPEDDPDALRVFLAVIHGSFDALPEKPPFNVIFPIAVLSDKYNTVASLKHFWKPWIYSSWRSAVEDELFRYPLRRRPAHQVVRYLWLFYTLGWGKRFSSALCTVMHRTGLDGHGRPRVTAGDSKDLEGDDIYLDSGEYLSFINTSVIGLFFPSFE
jgi:hypothetical protein